MTRSSHVFDPQSDEPLISVVMITHRRPLLLRAALSSILHSLDNSPATFEFLVGVNGIDSESVEIISETLQSKRFRIFESSQGNWPSEARNRILRHASGEWIYFADDDTTLPTTMMTTFLRLSSNLTYDIFGGPNLTHPGASTFAHTSGLVLGSRFAAATCANRYANKLNAFDCDDSSLILCNLFVRRNRLSGDVFPAQLVCAEENAALARWRRQGAKMRFDPALFVFHERRANYRTFAMQIYKYGRGRGQLATRGIFDWFHFVPSFCIVLAIGLLMTQASLTLAALLVSYLLLLLIAARAIRQNTPQRPTSLIQAALLIVVVHVFYGFGLLRGALVDSTGDLIKTVGARKS